MRKFMLAAVAAGALALAGCQTANNPAGWGQIAVGVGQVVGPTKIDPNIAKVSAKVAAYCQELQLAALAVDALAPAKMQDAASHARATVRTFCAAPPTSVATALTSLAAAYAAIEAAKGAGA